MALNGPFKLKLFYGSIRNNQARAKRMSSADGNEQN